jgi:hypothetical protein
MSPFLVDCPFCGEQMRLGAAECPHCRETLEPPEGASVFDDQVDLAAFEGQVAGWTIAYLRGAELRGAFLGGIDLFGADLVAADLRGAELGEANLSSADLRGADLRRANLSPADLSDIKLAAADLRDALLRATNFEGALYDDSTAWPDGFDPAAAGAIHVAALRPAR